MASDNLGSTAGILAAAALLIGYVVTVAVSVSAGVAALTSIVPEIYPERVLIGVGMVAILMLGNLRGIRESGTIFMVPTYAYIVIMLGILGYGVVRTLIGDIPDYVAPAAWAGVEQGGQALGLFLILRAFSQGAVALTGVEAVSDGVPAFKSPEWRNARITLTWAAIIFGILFVGIAYLVTSIGIVPDPTEEQTVLSQLVRHLAGDGAILVIAQVSTALLLVLAANTSFADFPRLSSFLARDGYLPRQFAFRGERLALSFGCSPVPTRSWPTCRTTCAARSLAVAAIGVSAKLQAEVAAFGQDVATRAAIQEIGGERLLLGRGVDHRVTLRAGRERFGADLDRRLGPRCDRGFARAAKVRGPRHLSVRMADVPGPVHPDQPNEHAPRASRAATPHRDARGDSHANAEPAPSQERVDDPDEGISSQKHDVPGRRSAGAHAPSTSQDRCRIGPVLRSAAVAGAADTSSRAPRRRQSTSRLRGSPTRWDPSRSIPVSPRARPRGPSPTLGC
ncbi:MAG: amino acid permease [Candidatus Limnocylindria bacterium]